MLLQFNTVNFTMMQAAKLLIKIIRILTLLIEKVK